MRQRLRDMMKKSKFHESILGTRHLPKRSTRGSTKKRSAVSSSVAPTAQSLPSPPPKRTKRTAKEKKRVSKQPAPELTLPESTQQQRTHGIKSNETGKDKKQSDDFIDLLHKAMQEEQQWNSRTLLLLVVLLPLTPSYSLALVQNKYYTLRGRRPTLVQRGLCACHRCYRVLAIDSSDATSTTAAFESRGATAAARNRSTGATTQRIAVLVGTTIPVDTAQWWCWRTSRARRGHDAADAAGRTVGLVRDVAGIGRRAGHVLDNYGVASVMCIRAAPDQPLCLH